MTDFLTLSPDAARVALRALAQEIQSLDRLLSDLTVFDLGDGSLTRSRIQQRRIEIGNARYELIKQLESINPPPF
jgi:hypothetical protein